MRDRGAMSVVVMTVALAFVAAVTFALVPVLSGLIDHQRARSAADAAALAGVTGGRPAAAALAAANGAELVGWSRDGHRVIVEVRVGGQRVTARATDEP
ncbi:MAG TPA: hypothetical protein VIS05_00435 [Ilumatobacter sp.]